MSESIKNNPFLLADRARSSGSVVSPSRKQAERVSVSESATTSASPLAPLLEETVAIVPRLYSMSEGSKQNPTMLDDPARSSQARSPSHRKSHRKQAARASASEAALTSASPLAPLLEQLATIEKSPAAVPPSSEAVAAAVPRAGDDFLARLAKVEADTSEAKRVPASRDSRLATTSRSLPRATHQSASRAEIAPGASIPDASANTRAVATARAIATGRAFATGRGIATARIIELDPEVKRELSALDYDLIEVLGRGDIALVRSSWLLAQRDLQPNYRIVRRQDLKPVGGITPHLEPEEAKRLLLKGERAIGALSFGWPIQGNPDPTGHRIQAFSRALLKRTDIEAFFWDYPSLYQNSDHSPRTDEQDRAFKRGLRVV